MLIKVFLALSGISPYVKKLLWRQWYQFLAGHHQTKDWSFMNYGYAPLHDHSDTVKLDEADEPNRYFIQLYHHVVSAVDLTNLDVLEIGSGRGGGASYIKRYLKPKALTGVNFSDKPFNSVSTLMTWTDYHSSTGMLNHYLSMLDVLTS
jgi:hypothetical protein